ncbi:ribosome small subunit-dependent GTPase A [Phaeodactylibacter xiamenensis]|jgi:ribosome biogenesis GTPase|uniref:ribosome small subunit-dependent GTPase A n=1 Tax=Phaeodactylibacter xiamenensis TaxID=1524460 RepID=UPI0024A7B929|nr:ribosome small subunit-dependent GTPase A [Phaeodactylibacter xiamenensis]
MNLEDLGYNEALEAYRQEHGYSQHLVGRVTVEHRERYMVSSEEGEFDAELLGNLRYAAASKNDLPAVGDWVAISEYDEGKALIHAVFPRHTVLERQAVGKLGERQIIATNIDYGIIVQSVNRDFSINRLERYLTLCHAAKIQPLIVVTKVDLISKAEQESLLGKIRSRVADVPVFVVSNETQEGINALKDLVVRGKTYCLLGSSGVGKSSLINSLSGVERMKTGAISEGIDRGKHVTTHRELVPLVNGAVLIDNPGMREVGITDRSGGLEQTFEQIYALSGSCKFSDCTHTSEIGCAVLAALDSGDLEEATLENFYKMENEQAHFSSTVLERRARDKKFGKMYREVKKHKKKTKY